jgi:hypothetical protein
MKVEVDRYTKFILTIIAIGLLLNAVSPVVVKIISPSPVFASSGPLEVKIVDFRSTWPPEFKISNWPSVFRAEVTKR